MDGWNKAQRHGRCEGKCLMEENYDATHQVRENEKKRKTHSLGMDGKTQISTSHTDKRHADETLVALWLVD